MGTATDERPLAQALKLIDHQVSQTLDGAILLRLSVELPISGQAKRQHSLMSIDEEIARQLALDLLDIVEPVI